VFSLLPISYFPFAIYFYIICNELSFERFSFLQNSLEISKAFKRYQTLIHSEEINSI
jgi:hypothetical protein